MPLIAPRVQGPVNDRCTSVEVVGLLAGADVFLLQFDDASPNSFNIVLTQAKATGAAISISVSPAQLTAGKYLSAYQSTPADGPSEPSRVREKIAAGPASNEDLPPVVFLSMVYHCTDWILLGGLIPGATVEISYQGTIVSSIIARRPTESMPISMPQPLSPNTFFVAVQKFSTSQGIIRSEPVQSLPVEQRLSEHNRKLPAPMVKAPIECDEAVLVSNIAEGASVFIKVEEKDYTYGFYGSSFWALTPHPIPHPGTVTVQQGTRNCGDYTMSDPASTIVLEGTLPTPVPVGPVCGNASTLRVVGLRPGATVYIQYGTVFNDGRESWTLDSVFTGAWSTDCEFFLPSGWWYQNPPDGSNVLKVYQRSCAHTSGEGRINILDLPAPATPPVISPLWECARSVALTNVLAGSLITLWSDAMGGSQLSSPQRISDVSGSISTYRPVHYKEKIHAIQNGCGNSKAESLQVTVGKITALPAPDIQVPIRLPHGGIYLKNIVPGARVYVYVNDHYMLSRDCDTSSAFIAVPALQLNDRVKVIQTICTGISAFSESGHAVVLLGEMNIKQQPSPVQKNAATAITIEAFDTENGAKVYGDVWIGSTIAGKTFTAFTHVFVAGQPVPVSKVTALNYTDQSMVWKLSEPPVTTATLTLRLNNPNLSYPVTQVRWAIRKPDLGNPSASPVLILLNGAQVQTSLHKPDAMNPSVYIIECLASVQVSAGVVYDFPMRSAINFGGRNDWHQLNWSGSDAIANFRVVIEPVYYNGYVVDVTGSVQPQ